MIMSIIYPDSGSIHVLGGRALSSKDRIGYLPEERGLYRKMRVGEFLEYMARLKGVADRREAARRAGRWLERLELPGVYRRRCQELSKGMQQKVQFVAAVIHNPDLLILDEPFSGLDPVNSALLVRTLRELHQDGATIIFSTHILHQAEQLCDRIFLINKGVKLLDASLDEIRRRFDPRTIVAEPLNGALQLADMRGIDRVAPTGHDGQLEIVLAPGADPQLIMREIVNQHPVRAVRLRRVTLDEVFVRLVMEDQGAAAAATAQQELRGATQGRSDDEPPSASESLAVSIN